MKFKIIVFYLILINLISGCINFSNTPYIKEVYVNPPYIDSNTGQFSKIIYTISNNLAVDFKGKLFLTYQEDCLSMIKEHSIEVKSNSEKSGTIPITRAYYVKEDCYKDQHIILNLANEDGKLIYNSKEVTLKFIK